MDRVRVDVAKDGYDVCIGADLLGEIAALLPKQVANSQDRRVGVVTDAGVPTSHVQAVENSLRAADFRVTTLVTPDGERDKTLETLGRLCDQLNDAGLQRTSKIVAVGGGKVTDIGGFAAAIFHRGISWVAVPTTLVGQVDAAIGGKTAVDLPSSKNALGAFWQPELVLADTNCLLTLPDDQLRSGLAEVIKYGAIGDTDLLDLLEKSSFDLLARDRDSLQSLVVRCVSIKARIIGQDEKDHGARRALNFGHTVGHALEAATGYQLLHGEAVALGMVAAGRISRQVAGFSAAEHDRLLRLLTRMGLPTDLDARLDQLSARSDDAIVRLIARDKKARTNAIDFIALESFGHARRVELSAADIARMSRVLRS